MVDDHTIDVTAEPAQPILPLLLSLVTIVPSETPIEFVREPVGTGPYALTEWIPGQNVTLDRRDDYWGEAPAVTKATYVFRTDPAVAAAMVTQGEADLAPSISAVDATDPETDVSYLNSETFYLRIDHAVAPINDKRIREALNLALDRDAFIGTLLPEGVVKATAMVPPTTLGWNPDVQAWPYDPEKAKALVEEAAADGVPVDTPIQLIGRSNLFPSVLETVEAMQAMFQDVGLTVEVQMLEVAQIEELYNKPFKEGRPPQMLAVQHDNSRGDPVFSMFFKYDSEGRQSRHRRPEGRRPDHAGLRRHRRGAGGALVRADRLPARRGRGRRAALPHGELRPRRRAHRVRAVDRDQLDARARGHQLQVMPLGGGRSAPVPDRKAPEERPCPSSPRASSRASSRWCCCSSWCSSSRA